MSFDEDQLRRALRDHAATTPTGHADWDAVETGAARTARVRRNRAVVVTALTTAAAVLVAVVAVRALGGDHDRRVIAASPTTTDEAPSTTGTTSASSSFPYVPLWPFADAGQAEQWRSTDGPAGHSPWHADADATALDFATGYLGYTEMTMVTTHSGSDPNLHIGVGFKSENGHPFTAAVVHVVRFGPASDSPWEVVGTDDTDLTLDAPKYGSTVSSPVTVAGLITGVDESLHVVVHELASPTPIGDACCQPGGGQKTPWSMPVSFHATGSVVTIAVATGGHLQQIERFAVTGVRVTR